MSAETHRSRCLVLGGSGYVGAEVCRALAAVGARIVFTYFQNKETALALAAELAGARAIQLDLRDYAASSRFVEEGVAALGGLDALIQCAGTAGEPSLYTSTAAGHDKFLDIDEAGWDDMMDITAKGTFAACQAASRVMRKSGGGRIVFVGSIDGVKSVPAPIHYAAAKGALVAMTHALAKELGDHGILVNMVAAGILDKGVAHLLSDELRNEYMKHCSLKRVGTAREIANVVAWLALENTYVNGQTIILDGGL